MPLGPLDKLRSQHILPGEWGEEGWVGKEPGWSPLARAVQGPRATRSTLWVFEAPKSPEVVVERTRR